MKLPKINSYLRHEARELLGIIFVSSVLATFLILFPLTFSITVLGGGILFLCYLAFGPQDPNW